MKKKCELCKSLARMHCESDQANLCWACDYKVHTANFLVARHSRTLLCRVCQSPTPWTAAGANFGRAVSVCNCCSRARACDGSEDEALRGNECEGGDAEFDSDESGDGGIETSDEDEEGLEDEGAEVDDEDNQVVPWSPTTPPPASPSSNSEGESYSSSSAPCSPVDRRKSALLIASDLSCNANHYLSTFRGNESSPPEAVTSGESHAVVCGGGRCERDLKRRGFDSSRVGFSGPNTLPVVDSVKRVRREEMRSSALSRLSEEDSSAENLLVVKRSPSCVCFLGYP